MAETELEVPYTPHPPSTLPIERRKYGHHPQEAFHMDRYLVRYRALFAGTGGGKSHAAAFEVLSWALENPGSVGLLCQPDYPMIRRNLIEPGGALHSLLGDLTTSPIVRSYNSTEHRVTFRNSSIWWLLSLDGPEKAEGANVDYAWVDEIRLVRHWPRAWSAIKRRLRGSRPGNRTGAWVTTHSPRKEQADEFEGVGSLTGEYGVYRWSTRDNPVLTEAYVREIERSHTGAAYKAVVLGEHARPEGLAYPNFDPARNVQPATPTRNTQHMTYGVDFGWSVPSAVIAVQWTGHRAHVVEEAYGAYMTTPELVANLKRLIAKWGRGAAYCDPSAAREIPELVRAGIPAEPFKGDRDVLGGIRVLNGMFEGRELLIDPACVNLISELGEYEFRPGEDKPEKGRDHALDGLRYAVVAGRRPPRTLLSRA